MGLKRCLDCAAISPNTRCPEHTRQQDRARGTRTERGYTNEWARYSQAAIAQHRATHGNQCPGWNVEPHMIDPKDFVTDHDAGPMCRSCNARKAATHDRQRAKNQQVT